MENLTGKQLGPYRVIAPLGEGGMAAVYKAYQPSVNRYVAVKVLPQYFARDPQFVARFEREAQVLAQLQHPNILPIFDYGQSQGHTYIAMPLITGGSLAGLMQNQRLDFKTIRKIINQVGDALDYAHSRNLIHRDVKPANILIDERGNCLLTDFGLAKIVEGSAKLTSSGTIMGTPAYMSPEQGKGYVLDRRTDIYSLGIILYELAVGRAPFEADTPMVVVVKHINDPLPFPSSIIPDFSPALEQVIIKALEKDPQKRYQTASEFVEAVDAALETDRGTSSAARSATRVAPVAAGSVVAASPRVATAIPTGNQKPNLLQRVWWVIPIGLIGLIGFAALILIGLFIFNTIPKTSPLIDEAPTIAALQPTDTAQPFQQLPTSEINPDLTPLAPPNDLLVEDFEDGRAQDWDVLDGTAAVITLDDGNHAYQVRPGEFGGAHLVFPPSWDWSTAEGLVFEADVRFEDVQQYNSAARLLVRVQADTNEQACLNYTAELGAGWTGLSVVTAPDDNCENNWDSRVLAPQQGFELTAGEWHHLKIVIYQSQLQYFLDDSFIASANDVNNLYPSGGIGLFIGNTNQAYIDNLHAYSLNGQSPVNDETNWNVGFYHSFPVDFWAVGVHEYTLTLDCPTMSAGSGSYTQQFEVSDSLDPLGESGYLFLQIEGVFDNFSEGDSFPVFHPQVNTLAYFNFGGLSFSEAELALSDCTGEIVWDGDQNERLLPLIMFQR